MQVNGIKYNHTNPNFNALRLKKGSEKYVSSMPDKVLNKLDDVGIYLEDTKFYHLDVEKDGFCIYHSSGERLYPPILFNNAGKVLIIKAKQGVSQITKKLNYRTSTIVETIDNKIKQASTQFERIAEIVRVLDDYEKNLVNQEENIIINSKEPREEKIKKLMKKYGI